MAYSHEDWQGGVKAGSEKITGRVLHSSWFWIAFIFFGQGLCSVFFAKIKNIPPGEVFLPITVLFLGGVGGLLFLAFGDPEKNMKWRGIFPAIIYGSFIYLMSSRGFAGMDVGFDASYFHPVEFVTLGLFLGRFWYPVIDEKGFTRFSVRVIVAGGAFGCADEIHQGFVSGRTADVVDLMFDIAGILISLLIIAAVRRLIGVGLTGSRLS